MTVSTQIIESNKPAASVAEEHEDLSLDIEEKVAPIETIDLDDIDEDALPDDLPEGMRAISLPVFEDMVFQPIPTGEPRFDRLAPGDMLVDESYQRELTEKSRLLIRKIAENWDWRKFKPPVIAWTQRGYEVVDGQHTATAAMLRGDIPDLPVIIIEAENREDRAGSFVGHNADRLAVTSVQLYLAGLTAGDPTAVEVQKVCNAAGVTIIRTSGNGWRVGDSLAVQVIASLIKRRGADLATEILGALVDAELAPVGAPTIRAAEMLFCDDEYVGRFVRTDVATAIKALGMVRATRDAKLFAAAQIVPFWRALGIIWFQKITKKGKSK